MAVNDGDPVAKAHPVSDFDRSKQACLASEAISKLRRNLDVDKY